MNYTNTMDKKKLLQSMKAKAKIYMMTTRRSVLLRYYDSDYVVLLPVIIIIPF